MQVIRALAVGVLAIAAPIVACTTGFDSFGSGSVSGGTASAEPNGSSGIGGGTADPAAINACPITRPTPDSACGGDVGTCEYGTSPDPSCNVVATCESTGWVITEPSHCPTDCPGGFDGLAPGTPCNATDVCTYLEATCGCAGAVAPGLDGGSDADPDAEAGVATSGHWQCVRPGNGCPARRPQPGTHCNGSSTCDYGTCTFGAQLTYECMQHAWVTVPGGGCP